MTANQIINPIKPKKEMKKLASTLMLLASLSIFLTAGPTGDGSDSEAIKLVIQTAYVDGLQNRGDIEPIRKGFHEGFDLLGIRNNTLTKLPIYTWIEYVETAKAQNPDPPADDEIVTVKFLDIDVTGDAAVAKIELHKGGRHIFTDYLSLYRFDEGWRVVSKIYYRIPEEQQN